MDHRSAQTMLKSLIGTWVVRMTVHDEQGRGTISDSIRSKKEWFGGGQYVRETISGEFAGKPHNKLTILAFNPTRGRYEYVTADDNDTVILLYTSLPTQAGHGNQVDLFTEYLMPDSQSGKPQLITIRTRFAIQDRNRHTLQNFYLPPAGKEHLFLRYEYARLNEA